MMHTRYYVIAPSEENVLVHERLKRKRTYPTKEEAEDAIKRRKQRDFKVFLVELTVQRVSDQRKLIAR